MYSWNYLRHPTDTSEGKGQGPRLKNDKIMKGLTKTVDAKIKVNSSAESHLITIKRLQCTGATLLSSKLTLENEDLLRSQ